MKPLGGLLAGLGLGSIAFQLWLADVGWPGVFMVAAVFLGIAMMSRPS